MNFENPIMRLLVGIVAIAAALRLTWLLIEPVLPALAVAVVALTVLRLAVWWRDERW